MRTRMSSESGFTLLELLVVIAIIATVSVIVVPNLAKYREGSSLRAEAQKIFGNFQLAKMEAIKRSYPTRILFDFTGNGSYQIYIDVDNDDTIDAGEDIIVSESMPDNVKAVAGTFSSAGTKTGFNTRGIPLSAGTVVVSNLDGTKTITLTATVSGTVKLN